MFQDRSIMRDWAWLPAGLVQQIADCVLSTTGGVDSYMDMRAVCPSWRSAVARPPALAAFADFRFRPRQWVMLDLFPEDNFDNRLFLNVSTGRFRRLHLPALRDHLLFGITDSGLLVLGDTEYPHPASVLNPFTGDMVQFPALLRAHFAYDAMYTAVSGGSHSTLVVLGDKRVVSAAPNSEVYTEEDSFRKMTSMATFQGNIYYANMDGCVFNEKFDVVAQMPPDVGESSEDSESKEDDGVVAQMPPDVGESSNDSESEENDGVVAQLPPDVGESSEDSESEEDDGGWSSHLVESVGELLLVCARGIDFRLFRVDVERKLLEEVESLGGRALFLGLERSVSVDAGKLPTVNGDCIYVMVEAGGRAICMYNRREHTVKIIPQDDNLPFNLAQVILEYCDRVCCM